MTDTVQAADWLPVPSAFAADGLPSRVRIVEVGPRDGLQAESTILPASVKIELCRRLLAAGLGTIESTSFVPPAWIPQLADAEEVSAALADVQDRCTVLVPNTRGLERAQAAGASAVGVVVSATESFAHANLNASVATAAARAVDVVRSAVDADIAVRAYVSMAFSDPWEGPTPPERVVGLAASLAEAGAGTIVLGDTIGVATPGQVTRLVDLVADLGVPRERIAMHLHDTYGQGVANALAALQAGVVELDAAVGGVGRCPYAKGATGNLATEDLVWMLHGLGIQTGVDLEALVDTAGWLGGQLGRPVPSRVTTARMAARDAGLRAEPAAATIAAAGDAAPSSAATKGERP